MLRRELALLFLAVQAVFLEVPTKFLDSEEFLPPVPIPAARFSFLLHPLSNSGILLMPVFEKKFPIYTTNVIKSKGKWAFKTVSFMALTQRIILPISPWLIQTDRPVFIPPAKPLPLFNNHWKFKAYLHSIWKKLI